MWIVPSGAIMAKPRFSGIKIDTESFQKHLSAESAQVYLEAFQQAARDMAPLLPDSQKHVDLWVKLLKKPNTQGDKTSPFTIRCHALPPQAENSPSKPVPTKETLKANPSPKVKAKPSEPPKYHKSMASPMAMSAMPMATMSMSLGGASPTSGQDVSPEAADTNKLDPFTQALSPHLKKIPFQDHAISEPPHQVLSHALAQITQMVVGLMADAAGAKILSTQVEQTQAVEKANKTLAKEKEELEEEVHSLQDKVDQLESQLEEVQPEKERLEVELSGWEKDYKTMDKDYTKAHDKLAKMETLVEDLQADLAEAKYQLRTYKAQAKENQKLAEQYQGKLEAQKAKMYKLLDEVDYQKRLKADLTQDKSDALLDAKEAQKRQAQLERQLASEKKKLDALTEKFNAKLDDMERLKKRFKETICDLKASGKGKAKAKPRPKETSSWNDDYYDRYSR